MTICQKDGKWQDEDVSCSEVHSPNCKTPDFKSLGKDQMGFRNVNHTFVANRPSSSKNLDPKMTFG